METCTKFAVYLFGYLAYTRDGGRSGGRSGGRDGGRDEHIIFTGRLTPKGHSVNDVVMVFRRQYIIPAMAVTNTPPNPSPPSHRWAATYSYCIDQLYSSDTLNWFKRTKYNSTSRSSFNICTKASSYPLVNHQNLQDHCWYRLKRDQNTPSIQGSGFDRLEF